MISDMAAAVAIATAKGGGGMMPCFLYYYSLPSVARRSLLRMVIF